MTPCLVTSDVGLRLSRCAMPSRKEVEREILKINKEISDNKWQIKNEVLSDRQKQVKRNKITQLKATRKDLTKQVEGFLPETVRTYGVQNR